jgi:type III pantothenate kinase
MTQLLLDVGNSRIKWAYLLDGGRLEAGGAAPHGGDPAAITDRIADRGIERAWAANVTGPALGRPLDSAVQARFGVPLQFAEVSAERSGLRVAYADASRLGVDRWLSMLVLWLEQPGAFVVASAGTALTFDAVGESGQHLGGVIAPGLMTAQLAVLDATRFPADGPQPAYESGLGDDTESCVRQGALHACAGLVERLAARYGAGTTRRVLTGGDAPALAPRLAGTWIQRPDLVLEGLARLAALS